ncbi:MAG: SUMF1/EgtB/PvdO family nonheme iron enzyme [Deltaproteobacteria bacterium]|nr:SUMF1/EgtB/PvdO family nonheme iron enzyme [Deltaproteobacteria bacterium]
MVAVGGFCIDRYEASRPDATATSAGKDGSRAMSVLGVLPWMVADNATAEKACAASGKRLCLPEEWRIACQGPDGTVYAYGDAYDPAICNGIDTFGRSGFHLTPTGDFAECTNEWGVFDINGNLWEHTAGGSEMTVRGGAFNCNDSATLHRCDYVPGDWVPSALGFRCCLTPSGPPVGSDGGLPGGDAGEDGGAGDAGPDASPDSVEDGAGCVSFDEAGTGDAGQAAQDAVEDALSEEPDGYVSGEVEGDATVLFDGPVDNAGLDATSDGPTSADAEAAPCPPEMALVGSVCIDRYEASRPDATDTSAGTDDSKALSRAGVLPWYANPMSDEAFATFQAACAAAGKRLCEPTEWLEACEGPEKNSYVFGNDWDPTICNSVDTYCQECCDILGLTGLDCPTGDNCGYSSSLTSSYTPETCTITAPYGKDTCHVCYHVMPTGSFPKCTSGNGLFDVNGNVWEIVPVPASENSPGYRVRGGAFNCGMASTRFRCTFADIWSDLYAGFRCCKDPSLP